MHLYTTDQSASDRCIRIRVSEYQINLSIDTERNLCNGPMVHGVVARWQINFPLQHNITFSKHIPVGDRADCAVVLCLFEQRLLLVVGLVCFMRSLIIFSVYFSL